MQQLLPDMSLTVRLRREGKVTDQTLIGPFSIVGPQVSDQGRLVRAGVVTQVTLVRGQAQVGPDMA